MIFVYILQCSDGSYYTGYTTDIKRRLQEHNEGLGSKYTRGRRPVKCVYHEEMASKSDALKRELNIKKLNRSQKERLIQANPGKHDYNT
ncbi:MAG: GIY-YIG nuclease family protein [Syntrophomonadaceae bacterium]|nr:GIY-YIG nuclease family protein [Syntrophomonadaceae bacterium]MDD3023734.1 GIY-YIG nuclease family protein [Syntrophomonadaceae bacterium]